MNKEQLNNLRPGDKVTWQFRGRRILGKVHSVMRDNYILIKWADGELDKFPVDNENGKYVEKGQ